LGAIAVREAVKRAKVDPPQVDECIMGLVVAAGLDRIPRARRRWRWIAIPSGNDHQQGLWFGIESRGAGDAGHPDSNAELWWQAEWNP